MTERESFRRNMLRDIKNEEHYIKKMEYIIIEEGKRILDSLNVNYHIVPQKNITKFLSAHPEFKEDFNNKTVWHQIRLQRLLDTKLINTFQYQLLTMMKQVLNKNNKYILRKDEFESRIFVMNCKDYQKTKRCLKDDCKASENCPHFYKNEESKYDKRKRINELWIIKKHL